MIKRLVPTTMYKLYYRVVSVQLLLVSPILERAPLTVLLVLGERRFPQHSSLLIFYAHYFFIFAFKIIEMSG